MPTTEPNHRFLRACLGLPTDRAPIWIMRQAGRYLPEYMQVRREAGDFLSLCKNPELAAKVTWQPIERFGLDAAILFSDILVIPEAMGMGLSFGTGEGPILNPRIETSTDVERLRAPDPEKDLKYVMDAIRTIRTLLADRVPLIGFSGSPWTLATYMVEGGSSRSFTRVLGMLREHPEVMQRLLDRLIEAVTDYLNAQIRHGVQAVQIFDTWGGVLDHDEFLNFSLESMRRIVAGLRRIGPDGMPVPVILFAKGCGEHLEAMAESGCQVVGLDWTTDIGQARLRVGGKVALQGNMDPGLLRASPEEIRQEAERILRAYGPHPGHIFNLGHGIAPDCLPERVGVLVEAVRNFSFQGS
ncbi:Uroporphyrinogen decarboxylase [Candidatus Magnetaquicoccaceae bacterium FCR-1]|uniref:Uroporphyrinogen decarboxylase n=1 Tax=Candidatus Magnetaquiglobus chichijimensis TaxID=3141448 RepID=A0ABQ0CCD9_9PROT